jgi:hypothetical protein
LAASKLSFGHGSRQRQRIGYLASANGGFGAKSRAADGHYLSFTVLK